MTSASLKEALQANVDGPLLHLIVIDMGNRREGPWHNDMQNASEVMLSILRQAPFATLITASDCWANSGSYNNSVRDLNMQFQQTWPCSSEYQWLRLAPAYGSWATTTSTTGLDTSHVRRHAYNLFTASSTLLSAEPHARCRRLSCRPSTISACSRSHATFQM